MILNTAVVTDATVFTVDKLMNQLNHVYAVSAFIVFSAVQCLMHHTKQCKFRGPLAQC